jgi:hypothetical protein
VQPSFMRETECMNTEELLKSLQQWLRAGIKEAPDTREVGAGAEGASKAPEKTTHETNHPKDPAGGRPE